MAKLSKSQRSKRQAQKKYGGGVPREAKHGDVAVMVRQGEEPAAQLAMEVRARRTGLPLKKCMDPRSGTFIGVLALRGEANKGDGLSQPQYDALLRAFELRQEYYRALSVPDSLAKRSSGVSGDFEPDSLGTWAKGIIRRYDGMKCAIQEQQNIERGNLFAALDLCVYRDQEIEYMAGDLRILGNTLVHYFNGN